MSTLQRGGAWVVLDPSINSRQMEMYADVESRAGVLGILSFHPMHYFPHFVRRA